MKAINLIPADERRGSVAGRSGGGVYALLAALAVAVLLLGGYVLANKSVADRHAKLRDVNVQADRAEATADALKPYQDFAMLRQQRSETVTSLAKSRFDWAHALHEVARTIPSSAWLSSLSGSTTQASTTGTPSASSQSSNAPSVQIQGCETSQGNVARLMSAMRQIDGVASVSLSSSKKGDSSATSTPASGATPTGSGSDGGCPAGHPAFDMTITFEQGTSK